MVTAVVFDVGETLIDETRIWMRWAKRLNVPGGTLLGLIGAMVATDRPLADAFRLVRPGLVLEDEISAWELEDPDGLRVNFNADDLYPDVRDGLSALRSAGYRLIIAGNQPVQARDALAAMDLPVESIHTSEGWGVAKPDPAFFDKVTAVTGCPPADILYVGDRLDNDVLPAGRAGMRTALLRRGPWGYLHAARPEAAQADLLVDDLRDLAAALADRS
ncbi:HAD family hydrolase [Thermopolyspora sp. NPDC052614]|uniref:HAD family hydrolase n=1 Tax=Thermopolyspora sp. NPDC052614 TaxID=3155682 RepID=UPI0034130652